MNPDQLADYFKAGFDRLHELVNAYPDRRDRVRLQRKTADLHEEADEYLRFVKNLTHPKGGPVVQPRSGGIKP